MQGRTHHCAELRLSNVGEEVKIVGWYENIRKVSKTLGFAVLRDFYGITQVVIETEEMMNQISEINTESTLEIIGIVRERSSKNESIPTGEIEVVPSKITVLGKCKYNELPFQINHSKDADENAKLAKRMKRIDDLKSVLLRTLDRNFKKDVLSMRISVDRGFEDVIDDVLDSVDFICYDVKQLTVNSDYLVAFPNTPIMLEITRRG